MFTVVGGSREELFTLHYHYYHSPSISPSLCAEKSTGKARFGISFSHSLRLTRLLYGSAIVRRKLATF